MNPHKLKSKIEELNKLAREKNNGRQLYYNKLQDKGFCIAFSFYRDNHDTKLVNILEKCVRDSIQIANQQENCKERLYYLEVEGHRKSTPYVITAKFQANLLAIFLYTRRLILLQVMREKYFEPIILKKIYSSLEKFCLREA